MDVERLALPRAPCSTAEREAAAVVREALGDVGLRARLEPFPAPTSATWVHLFGALFRLAAAGLLATGVQVGAVAFAGAAFLVAVAPQAAAALIGRLPRVGGESANVVVHRPGATEGPDPPLVIVAHLDAHASGGVPLSRPHRALAGAVSWGLALAAGLSLSGVGGRWVAVLALEPLVTMVWLLRRELSGSTDPDDNASGLAALVRVAQLVADPAPVRDVWLVATGAATCGNWGIYAFLRAHPRVARLAWVLELDALGTAEIVVCPARQRLPRATTPAAIVRAVAGAAVDTGDPIDIRRVRRPHSDADAAFGRRVPALTLTAGLTHVPGVPQGIPAEEGLDRANVERVARIVDRLARTSL